MAEIQEMIDSTSEKLKKYLEEIYPDFADFGNGSFTLQEGSAIISVTVRPWYEEDIAVEFTSQLVSGAEITPELLRWLLEKNVELHFGGFGLMFDGTIVYSQTLPAGDLSSGEFQATARTVATIADHYDDEIVANFGGQLAGEAMAEDAEEAVETE